jgi:serine O-acetyltransferase
MTAAVEPVPAEPLSSAAKVRMDATELERRYGNHGHLLRLWRVNRWCHRRGLRSLSIAVSFAQRCLYSADLPSRLDLPDGVVLMHNGLGTVVHGDTRFLGPAVVFPGVTLGNSWGRRGGAPTLGPYVLVGAGAKVLGGISVGADSIIGANAVVTTDVPPGSMATGNPALITPLRREQLESAFFRSRRP